MNINYTQAGGIDIMLLVLSVALVVLSAGCACAGLIRFKCPGCGKDMTIPDSKGHTTTCTRCGTKVRVNAGGKLERA